MIPFVFIVVSFATMVFSDVLKMRGQDKAGKRLFALSLPVLGLALMMAMVSGPCYAVSLPARFVFFALTALGAWGEYASLFGALPVKDTYLSPQADQKLVDSGVYALCRHPGALFFPLMFVSLALGLGSRGLLFSSLIASTLNLLYVVFQDQRVFPVTIPGYDGYRQRVPFLLPTAQSIARAFGKTIDKQDDV